MLCYTLVIIGILYYLWDRHRKNGWIEDIQSKCVFVTGCDSGFGRALVTKLDVMGCRTIAGCLTEKGAAEVNAATSARLTTVQIDITDTLSVQNARKVVENNLPESGLYALVNNAGIGGVGGPIEFLTADDFMRPFKVNVTGTADVVKQFLPLLKKSRGRIVNMVSMAGRTAFPLMGDYVVSKFGSEGLADCLRREVAPWGITLSILEPGLFKTDIVNTEQIMKLKNKQWETIPQETKDQYGEDYQKQSCEYVAKLANRASNKIHLVVDSYINALFALHPQTRYTPGKDGRIMSILASLPAFVQDMFFERISNKYPQPKALST